MSKTRRPAHLVAKQEAAARGLTAPEGVRGVWMDTRFEVNIENFNDLLIDQYSAEIGFGNERFLYLLSVARGLPPDHCNKPFLADLVQRIRDADEARNKEAVWLGLQALRLAVLAVRLFIPMTDSKLRQEAALTPETRAAGTNANKAQADTRKDDLHKAINDYLDNYPDALAKGNKACLRFLVERGLIFGYAEATVLDQHIKNLFAAKRQVLKAEK